MRRHILVAGVAGLLVIGPWSWPSHAHTSRGAGESTVVGMGWETEPAYVGFPNAVQVDVEHDGEPIADAELEVVVIYGDADGSEATEPMPLVPVRGRAGDYRAALIPTETGTYTFRVTGRAREDRIDLTITSGAATFDPVVQPRELQFPTKLASTTEVLERAEAQAAAIDRAVQAADDAASAAGSARLVAMIALAVGALAGIFGFLAYLKAVARTTPAP